LVAHIEKEEKAMPLDSGTTVVHRATTLAAISVTLLVLSTTITIPHLQSRRDVLGCDAMCLGSITSARSAISVVGASIMGRFSDSAGGNSRKISLLIGSIATIIGMLIAVRVKSITGMWMSMIPGALLQHNFNTLKALITDFQDENVIPSERAGALGKLGMAAGLAFMLGPITGSTLLTSFEQAHIAGIMLAIISMGIDLTLPNPQRKKIRFPARKGMFDFINVNSARSPGAILFIVIRIAMALAFHVFQTIWSVALRTRYSFGPADYGKFMSFIGLTYALSQGFLAKFLLTTFGANDSNRARVRIILVCCITLAIGRYMAFETKSLLVIYILFALIVTALGVVNTIFAADTSYLAPSEEIGSLFGLLSSAESIAGMVGPALGGALTYIHPIQAPLFFVLSSYGTVFFLVASTYEKSILHGRKTVNIKID
jgi:Major Facilitator Superfamily